MNVHNFHSRINDHSKATAMKIIVQSKMTQKPGGQTHSEETNRLAKETVTLGLRR
jgi:hypothetical protein